MLNWCCLTIRLDLQCTSGSRASGRWGQINFVWRCGAEPPLGCRGKAPDQRLAGRNPPEADIFLFQRLISLKNYHINLGNVDYMASVGARLRPHMTVRWSEERNPSEADDIYLFQRLISLKNYHINLGNVDYMASVGARMRHAA